ncbi:transketolase C-terminal domain-containing protein [Streptomyces sp. R41]|uniref:Transketolase C-terminal domain-containing protein n=1 Tax=Streptomyces sp. R41 TaxID=3238632 RepID=A0AB39RFR6_9ACTN
MNISLAWLSAAEFTRILDGIDDPYDRSRAFADASRINTLYSIMRAGSGHLGSSFSAADAVAWLLLHEMRSPFEPDGDIYFSSKGHDAPGLYASLTGLGALPEDKLHQLRRLGGLPGHPDVSIPHMHANTGSLGMGISRAKGMILADRLAGVSRRIFVLTGDGELQEGQNWEALAGAVHHSMGELTVIVDHNKIQSDTWVADVSDLGDLEAKFRSFGWGVLRCDGNSAQELDTAFRLRQKEHSGVPAVIIADTVKGAGAATFAATSMPEGEWRYRFHSGAPAVEDYRSAHQELLTSLNAVLARHGLAPAELSVADVTLPVKAMGPQLPQVYGRALVERALADERIVALDADLVLDTGLIPFSETLPQRFFECGIAEQDMVSMAGGLASRDLLPFVHSFSCFLHARPNEQMYTNASEHRKIVYVGSLAGLIPAAPGHSHQAVRDVSALGAIPGLVVLEPANSAETEAALDFCIASESSTYLRLVSTPVSAEAEALGAEPLTLGRGRVVRAGGRAVAIGSGPIVLTQLVRAAELLAAQGIELTVVDLPWLNRVDSAWLADLTAEADELFVVENHYTHGGQADLIARALLERGDHRVPAFTGIGLTEVPKCGTEAEVLDAHGLSAERLAARFRARIRPSEH